MAGSMAAGTALEQKPRPYILNHKQVEKRLTRNGDALRFFEISTAHPHWHLPPNKATQSNLSPTVLPVETKHQLRAYSNRSQKPPHHYSVSIFTFTDETKVIYKAAATQDTIPEAPEKDTHNGNVPTTQPSSSPNGLDSGQVAI